MTSPTKGLVERLEEWRASTITDHDADLENAALAIRELHIALEKAHLFANGYAGHKKLDESIAELLSKYQPEDK